MPDELEERLQSHARAFDSLLSLIPAKRYYGEDVSDQWKRKKQTPEQKRAAKTAKLDPDNWKSAKDALEERATAELKRKREHDDTVDGDIEGIIPEKPKSEQDRENPKLKKQKLNTTTADSRATPQQAKTVENREAERKQKAERKAARKERNKEKKIKAREGRDQKRLERGEKKADVNTTKPNVRQPAPMRHEATKDDSDADEDMGETMDMDEAHDEAMAGMDEDHTSTALSSPDDRDNEVFSPQADSSTSSISSFQPGTTENPPKTKSQSQLPQTTNNPAVDANLNARQRLHAALSSFRTARKADTFSSTQPRNRAELLEMRRRKAEERKAAKKEQRRREKDEEARRQDEEIAKRFSPGGSGSLLASPRSPMIDSEPTNFQFGRVAFSDGSNLDSTLSTLQPAYQKKGPSDTRTALQLAQNKKSRLSSLDEKKRAEIEEKDMWLNARKRAHGEKVRDDTSLLKKALKRQESQKKKSEKEWGDREKGIAQAQIAKQKKRTENLKKRKDEKGGGGKNKVKKVKVKRPGFEGSFRGRTGGGGGKK